MTSRKASLRQRRWATGLDILKPKEKGLEQRVTDAFNGADVRVKEHFWADPNRVVFTELGFLKYGRGGFPAVADQNGNWYLLQPSKSVESGKFYRGNFKENSNGFFGAIEKVLGYFKGNREVSSIDEANSLTVVYNKNDLITLEDALKLQRSNVPVYEGNTQEFVKGRGPFKRKNPIQAKITTDGDIEIIGTVVISSDDYRSLSNYLFDKGQPPSRTIERLVEPRKHDRATVPRKKEQAEYDGKIEPEESSEGPKYLNWLSLPAIPGNLPTANSALATEAFDAQDRTILSIDPLKGWKTTLESIMDGEFEYETVSVQIRHIEQVPTDKGKGERVWVAYAIDEKTGKEGYFVLNQPLTGIIEVARDENYGSKTGQVVREIFLPRPISYGLNYWPIDEEFGPEEVRRQDLWRLGIYNNLVIEGVVAVPRNHVEYEGMQMLGVLGMNRSRWRSMMVNKVALDVLSEVYKSDKHTLNEGLQEVTIHQAVREIYDASPEIQAVASGGVAKFVQSVIDMVHQYHQVPTATLRQLRA